MGQWLFLWFAVGNDELLCDVEYFPGDVAVVLSGEVGGESVAVPIVGCGDDELLCDVAFFPGDVAVVLLGEAGGGSEAVPVVARGR